ncbi:putative PGG domain-containing protein [Helianthus annuus]|nr:putative PGG domain-containing protein [Helianthus annuus]KAJ0706205.1 putative PGG domain-containing protein [Helianthus annuus]KAJ0710294.1 putative PGG domain-containing protein [Helianthus annuus]
MVFTREHENLVKEGEKWMKTTAGSCSIAAALITTIVFAAAITVPGGSNQEKGTPLFKKGAFITFCYIRCNLTIFIRYGITSVLVYPNNTFG